MLDKIERITVQCVAGAQTLSLDVAVVMRVGSFAVHVSNGVDARSEGFKTDAYTVTHVPTGRSLLAGIKNKRDALSLAQAADALGFPDDGSVSSLLREAALRLTRGTILRKAFQPKGAAKKKVPESD